jgi:hypothetical protein
MSVAQLRRKAEVQLGLAADSTRVRLLADAEAWLDDEDASLLSLAMHDGDELYLAPS